MAFGQGPVAQPPRPARPNAPQNRPSLVVGGIESENGRNLLANETADCGQDPMGVRGRRLRAAVHDTIAYMGQRPQGRVAPDMLTDFEPAELDEGGFVFEQRLVESNR